MQGLEALPDKQECICLQVDAIVFLVDAVDRDRFLESKRELDGLLADEALAKVCRSSLLDGLSPFGIFYTFTLLGNNGHLLSLLSLASLDKRE